MPPLFKQHAESLRWSGTKDLVQCQWFVHIVLYANSCEHFVWIELVMKLLMLEFFLMAKGSEKWHLSMLLHTDREKKPASIFVCLRVFLSWCDYAFLFFFWAFAIPEMSNPLVFLTIDGILGRYLSGDKCTDISLDYEYNCQLPAMNNSQISLPVLSL